MALYVNPDSPKNNLAPVKTFYVDDSKCEVSGVQHTLLGAITFWDESPAISDMLRIKRRFGLKANQEIKWNSQEFTESDRYLLTEEMLSILPHCRGFLIITDQSKHAASLKLAVQLSDFCKTQRFGGFVCRFDQNIVGDHDDFDRAAFALDPPCAGWSEIDSAHDQLIQCADIFVGFQKMRLDFGMGQKNPNKMVEVEAYEGERSSYPIGWFVRLGLRHSLWGKVDRMDKSGAVWKHNLGLGVRISSALPDDIQKQLLSHLDQENLGCIH
jgi:hypothetical protein